MSYDVKFRKRALEYLTEGHTYQETAKTFGISPNTLNEWVKKHKCTGNLERRYRSYTTKISPKELEEYLSGVPDAYQFEIAEHFGCTQSTVCRTLKLLHMTRKKKTKRYKEQDSQKAEAFLREMADIPKGRIAYVDETGVDTYLHRPYCYAKRGKNIIGYVSGKKYKRVGIVAAQIDKDIISPLQYDGTMDSMLFETKLMCELPLNSVVVMDNAAFHRKKRLIYIAEKYGHRLIFLPPYSPDLNPIEHFWAWLKAAL